MRLCGGVGGLEPTSARATRVAAACTVILAALWTLSPSANADAANTLPPGRIASLIPSDDEVSQYVGLPVHHLDDPLPARPRFPDHLEQRDECRSLVFANTVEVWSSDFTAFRSQDWTYQPDPGRVVVSQSVGTFSSAGAAQDRSPSCSRLVNHRAPVPSELRPSTLHW